MTLFNKLYVRIPEVLGRPRKVTYNASALKEVAEFGESYFFERDGSYKKMAGSQ